MLLKADKNKLRQKRHLRVRNHVAGTAARPRLNVFRSLAHIYAQIIDDEKGMTLAAASSLDKDFKGKGGNIAAAKAVGTAIAKKALEKGISEVVFDRGGYIYHGRVAALAQAARDGGLKF
ncbi:MAG: 50S ribosomal protein L18 [Selenomonadaceae bacterium]|nr:50S ribosomal protein L18 [Selenomonadaceae bacterium]